ncbi:MAG: hypothetical protein PVH29_00710 [Candidatus Zixiibacteriota bacterium]|jgi:hypothetical protein
MEKWVLYSQILGPFVALLAVLVAAYYAWQARKQAKEARKQAVATKDLVLQGERSFAPNAVGRIYAPEVQRPFIAGKFIRADILFSWRNDVADIRILLENLSNGISEFELTIFPWLEFDDGTKVGFEKNVTEPLYRGIGVHYLLVGETIDAHFHINFKQITITRPQKNETTEEDVEAEEKTAIENEFLKNICLGGCRLHIEVFIDYTNEKEFKVDRFFEHYYSGDHIRYGGGDEAYGEWIYGGRSKTPKHP